MSTFKEQPVYAELLLGILDATSYPTSRFHPADVLRSFSWVFKGGMMGGYPMRMPTESSGTRFPSGDSWAIAESWEHSIEARAMEALLRNRREDRRLRVRARQTWVGTWLQIEAVKRLTPDSPPTITGLAGVYFYLRHTLANLAKPPNSARFSTMEAYIEEMVTAAVAPSPASVSIHMSLTRTVCAALGASRLPAVQMLLLDFDRAWRGSRGKIAYQRSRVVGALAEDGETQQYDELLGSMARFDAGGTILRTARGVVCAAIRGRVVAMSNSDCVRVHQFLTGFASGLVAVAAQVGCAPGRSRLRIHEAISSYDSQVTRILTSTAAVPPGDEVMVCKVFKRALGVFQGELAGPLCASETVDLLSECRATQHASTMEWEEYLAECRRWPAGMALNLGKAYKLCPAPDSCPGQSMIERHEQVTNANQFDATFMEEFTSSLRAQILRALVATPGVQLKLRDPAIAPQWWDDYKKKRLDLVPSDEIHRYLAWEGSRRMPIRSAIDPSVWKDSGLGWDTMELANDPERPRAHGNMITRMLFDQDLPLPDREHMHFAHDHKADIKPEGHKSPSRVIFSGNLRDRQDQSVMELAVEEVASNHPSFMIGAGVDVMRDRLATLVARPDRGEQVVFYYSFDVKGWSPNMCGEVQRVSHSIWGDVYDSRLFRWAHNINEGARVYMNKGGYRAWFVNPTANFEGYNGKEMTMLLVTLMAVTVRTWRARSVDAGILTEDQAQTYAAFLLAYIDDGLAKLTLPVDKAADLIALFKETAVATFRRGGFTIEVSKCYPSDSFAIFLNEPYLAGRHVVHGVKAAMTICSENTEEHETLAERAMAVSTGCRGAVMSGLVPLAAVILQAYHVHAHFIEWTREKDPVLLALFSMSPRAWGGLGLPNMMQLSTSGSGASLEEGVATLQSWAKHSTPARKLFLVMARSEMATRSARGVLTAPLGGTVAEVVIRENQIPALIRRAMADLKGWGKLSQIAGELLSYEADESYGIYAEAVVALGTNTTVQEQILNDLETIHPHAIFSAFARRIEKASTLKSVVGQKALRSVIKRNRANAVEAIARMTQTLHT